jgi:hypothetical protein
MCISSILLLQDAETQYYPNESLGLMKAGEFVPYLSEYWCRGSAISTSITTGFGLDGQGGGIRVRYDQEFTFLQVVQTVSGVHPASYPLGTGEYIYIYIYISLKGLTISGHQNSLRSKRRSNETINAVSSRIS